MNPDIPPEDKALIRRYLVWCYKSTKESLDRVDRKFTQLQVDHHVLASLQEQAQSFAKEDLSEQIDAFKKYIQDKEKAALEEKFVDSEPGGSLEPEYLYLKLRLQAIERAIEVFWGAQEVGIIRALYENEMTRRILESREH